MARKQSDEANETGRSQIMNLMSHVDFNPNSNGKYCRVRAKHRPNQICTADSESQRGSKVSI